MYYKFNDASAKYLQLRNPPHGGVILQNLTYAYFTDPVGAVYSPIIKVSQLCPKDTLRRK